MFSILYVDDEPDLLEIGKMFLEQGGQFRVDTLASATSALEILRTREYDAIISDYQMPEMDGIGFLKQVRASGSMVPFIIFTGRGREEIVIQAFNEGADFYLQKGGEPLSQFAELGHKVQAAILHRRAEASIRDHERREADIINFLPDATFAIDTHGVVIAWNRAMEKMTGVSPDDIIGKGNYEYALPFYHERRPLLINLVLTDDSALAARYPFVKKEGKTLFSEITIPHFNDGRGAALWFTASPLYDRTGEMVGAIESIREITGWKRTEEALRESEEFLNSVVENLPDMIFIKDARDLRFVRFNRAGEDLLGYSRSELCGKSDYDFFPRDEADFFIENDRKVLEQKHAIDIPEEKIRTRFRGGRILHTKKIPILDETGNPLYLMGISRDITEKIQQERIIIAQRDLGIALQAARGMKETLDICLQAAIRLSGLDAGGIYLVDEQTGSVDLAGFQNLHEEFIAGASRFSPGSRIATIIKAKKPVYLPFAAIQSDHPSPLDAEGLQAVAILPIVSEGRIIASVNLASHTLAEIPAAARVALETIAIQIGGAVERIRNHEALIASEERYRNIVEDQTEFICRFRPDGTHFFVNEAYCRYFGLDRDQVVGQRFRPRIHPEDRQRVERFFASLSPQHPVDIIEHRIIMAGGSVRWQRWSDRAIFDRAGKVAEYQSVGRDTTEKKEAEEALHRRESESRILAGLLDLIPASVTVHDEEGRFLYANQKTFEYHGYAKEEFYQMNLHDLDVPESEQLIEERIRELRQKGTVSFEVQHYRKDRSTIPLLINTMITTWENKQVILSVATDITDRKMIETALSQSEARYRSLSEASEDLIFVIDRDDRIVYVNSSAAAMFGMSPREITGKPRKDLFPPHVAEGQAQAIQRVLATGEGFRSTGTLIFGDRVFWFDHSLMPIRDASGTIIQVLGISRDITGQKKIEEALQRKTGDLDSRNRLISTLLDTVPIGIFMVEAPSGKPIVANREATRLLGRGILPDATEKNLAEVYEAYRAGSCTRYPAQEMPIVRGMYGESLHIDDMIVVRPDGTRARLEVFGTPVSDNRGTVVASLVSFLDITDRKCAEAALEAAQEKYTKAFHSVPDAITISEMETGRFIEVNEAATVLFGYTRDELIGKSAVDLGIWTQNEDRAVFIDRLQKQGRAGDFEVVERRKSGELYDAVINADTLSLGGQKCILSVIRDVTGRNRAEQVIREANRKINLLTSITRHDVANQVSILRGYTRIALMKRPGPDITSLLEKIETAVNAIACQIEFTRTYQELGMHTPGWQNIRAIVAQQKTEGVSLTCTCDADVYADPMLERVFFNLVDNAIRHGEKTTAITVSCRPDQDALVIVVTDDGIGIPPEQKEQIFEKGFGKNTGFGLFLAREILAITKITIRETGATGKGAVFEITVPKGTYRFAS